MPPQIPLALVLMTSHPVHGAVIGAGTSGIVRASGRDWQTSIGVGALVGAATTWYMTTYGHPEWLRKLITPSNFGHVH